MLRYLPLLALWSTGCLIPDSLILKIIDRDLDGELVDGYVGDLGEATDCDDQDPEVGSKAPETCGDQTDNDCDGVVDEDGAGALVWYVDGDGDDFGLTERTLVACERPPGYAARPGDCDDTVSLANPGAREQCNGFDDDCNGQTDEAGDPLPWYHDADGDAFGDPDARLLACSRPLNHVLVGTDCDDRSAAVHPGAVDAWYDGVDADCAGGDDFDQDGDGALHPSAWSGEPPWDAWVDCDDTNPRILPGAPEFWYDGVDQDCDPSTEWDADGDGLPAMGAPGTGPFDCDDTSVVVGAPLDWYADVDGDGFGDPATVQLACARPPGTVGVGRDCNDDDRLISPDAAEACDEVDNDCDGLVNEDVLTRYLLDADGDGFAVDPADEDPEWACEPPDGYIAVPANATPDYDCDDTTGRVSPGIVENTADPSFCDGLDNDCSEETQADPTGPCGENTLSVDVLGSRYLLRMGEDGAVVTHDRQTAEEWCAQRGYHLWWVEHEALESALVFAALNRDELWTALPLALGSRVHIGVRNYCPSAMGATCFSTVPPSCTPRDYWHWYDPADGRCEWASGAVPPHIAFNYGTPQAMHGVLYNDGASSNPNATGRSVRWDLASQFDYAIILCERELP